MAHSSVELRILAALWCGELPRLKRARPERRSWPSWLHYPSRLCDSRLGSPVYRASISVLASSIGIGLCRLLLILVSQTAPIRLDFVGMLHLSRHVLVRSSVRTTWASRKPVKVRLIVSHSNWALRSTHLRSPLGLLRPVRIGASSLLIVKLDSFRISLVRGSHDAHAVALLWLLLVSVVCAYARSVDDLANGSWATVDHDVSRGLLHALSILPLESAGGALSHRLLPTVSPVIEPLVFLPRFSLELAVTFVLLNPIINTSVLVGIHAVSVWAVDAIVVVLGWGWHLINGLDE